MPDTSGNSFGWREPLGSDFLKQGWQAVRDLASDIADTITALTGRVAAVEGKVGLPIATLRATAAQPNIPAGWQPINMGTADVDTHNGWQGAAEVSPSQPTRWKVPVGQAGIYAVEGACTFGNVGAGANFNSQIRKNGAALPASWSNADYAQANGQTTGAGTGRKILSLNEGDYVELWGYYNASTWGTFFAADAAPFLTIERIR